MILIIQVQCCLHLHFRPVDSRTGMGGGMDSQSKLLSELLSDQAAFITSPKTSLANYWGALPPCPPVSTGLHLHLYLFPILFLICFHIKECTTNYQLLQLTIIFPIKTLRNSLLEPPNSQTALSIKLPSINTMF